MDDCPRFGKIFGSCRFEPRYDEPSLGGIFTNPGFSSVSAKINGQNVSIEDLTPMKKYIRDVCTRCGKTIERLSLNKRGDGKE